MIALLLFFFFNDTATTEIYTLSLHDALPIYAHPPNAAMPCLAAGAPSTGSPSARTASAQSPPPHWCSPHSTAEPGEKTSLRSEEHTSELQSRQYLVCRLLLEKKKRIREVAR